MKAVVQYAYGSTDVVEFKDVERPEIGDGEVLVRVAAAGVDPAVWHLMTGTPYLVRLFGFGLRAPKNPVRGTDVAGRVEAVGAKVARFRPGDQVFGVSTGSFAEYAVAREDRLVLTPANTTPEAAAAIPVSGMTALQGLRDAGRLQAGQRVLVIGAGGGVGTFAVQLAKVFGAEVTGLCGTAKVDLVRSIGADHVIDYTRTDFAADTRRYDLVLDIAGGRPLARLRQVLTPRGTLVLVGDEGAGKWFGMGRQLRAVLLSPFVGQRLRGLISLPRGEDLAALRELVESGQVVPVVDRTFALSEVPEAIRYVQDGRSRGKVVVTV